MISEHPYVFLGAVSLILGFTAGFVMHRSDFCLAGMFRDLFLFRRTAMIRSFVLLVVVSMALFEASRILGILSVYSFPLLYALSAANVVGGCLFGIGMVLAGGCVVSTLYKMGAGSMLSVTSFAGLVVGSGLYAEVHPVWAGFVKSTTMFSGKITLAQMLGVDPLIPSLIIGLPATALLVSWYRKGALARPSFAAGYLQPSRAALSLALIGAASFALVGMPLGVTTSYTKAAGLVERFLFPEHFSGLAFFKNEPLNFMHAASGTVLTGGPGPRYDALPRPSLLPPLPPHASSPHERSSSWTTMS